nr:glycoside hydrolase family 88 protein [uncultured Butyrivibrio sp.]
MRDYELIITETTRELENIMNVSLGQAAKDTVKKMMGRSVRSKDPMFWPAGMLMLGLSEAEINRKQAGDDKNDNLKEIYERAKSAVSGHVQRWQGNYGGRIDHVDDALAGCSLIKLSHAGAGDEYQKVIDIIYSYVMNAKTDALGSIIYNPGRNNNNIFADGIGQVSMFLASYARMKLGMTDSTYERGNHNSIEYYNESDYLSAIGNLYAQLANFYQLGRDSRSGLIYHGYRISSASLQDASGNQANNPDNVQAEKLGLLGWGRAVGWLMMGLSEAAILEKELKRRGSFKRDWSSFDIIPWYKELSKACLDLQREDGGFSWQLQAVEGHIDMSATGMIAYALANGYKNGVFDAESGSGNDLGQNDDDILVAQVKEVLNRCKECMYQHTKDGSVSDALSSCDDFGVHYQTYGNYPWGQGAVLAALSLLE